MSGDLFGPTPRLNDRIFAALDKDRPERFLTDDRILGMFQLAEYLDRIPFNPSVTRPFNPHWYIMDHHWKAAGHHVNDFHRACGLIYKFGYDREWKGWNYRSININGGHYWNLQPPGHVDFDDIINGKIALYNTYWNYIAPQYHTLADRVGSIIDERKAQLEIIGDMSDKKVLEFGCGPGWLLEYTAGQVGDWRGIDFSVRMLTEFAARLPQWLRKTLCCSIKDFFSPGEKYDLVLALSGAAHGMTGDDAKKCMHMLEPGGRFLAVTYGERVNEWRTQPIRDRYGITETYRKTDRPFAGMRHERIGIYSVYEFSQTEWAKKQEEKLSREINEEES